MDFLCSGSVLGWCLFVPFIPPRHLTSSGEKGDEDMGSKRRNTIFDKYVIDHCSLERKDKSRRAPEADDKEKRKHTEKV